MTSVVGRPRVLGLGWWYDDAAESLRGTQCLRCATPSFPPRAFCWRCGSETRPLLLPRSGRVVARSRIRVSPPGFPDSYDVGVIELAPDLRVMGRFQDGAPEHGEIVTVRTGLLRQDEGGPVVGPVFAADPTGTPLAPDGRRTDDPAG